ncbi:MAG: TIGR02647 family protein [Amphritea sp.]
MSFTSNIHEEINVLLRFSKNSDHEGLKVRNSAAPELVSATGRLFDKGLITQKDGGYLTPLGHEAADQAYALLHILSPTPSS